MVNPRSLILAPPVAMTQKMTAEHMGPKVKVQVLIKEY